MAVAAMAAAKMAGAAVNAYGQYMEGKASYESLNEKSSLNLLQAGEMIARMERNIYDLRLDADKFQGRQMVQAAASGTDVASGANLSALEETASSVSDDIANLKRETYFKKWMLEKEALGYRKEAKAIKRATNIKMAGTILSAAGGSAGSMMG